MEPIPEMQCNAYSIGKSIKELYLPGYKVEIQYNSVDNQKCNCEY